MVGDAVSTRRWMRGPSTPLRGALLGLLLERPGHGGDLAHRLVGRLGETWRIDANDVYRLLEQLEKEGLACSREERRREHERRSRLVYHPTERTAEALTVWMETLLPREPVRLGLQAKLAVARPEDAPRRGGGPGGAPPRGRPAPAGRADGVPTRVPAARAAGVPHRRRGPLV